MGQLYRQGDVLIVAVEEIPDRTKMVRRSKSGRIILAHGEVTGHAHAIAEPKDRAQLREDDDGNRFLQVLAPSVALVHQEHATIDLPAGDYRITRQREYTPKAIVRVAD
jgi:hypothetical protein